MKWLIVAKKCLFFIVVLQTNMNAAAQHRVGEVRLVKAGSAWAGNSVNTVVFRKNALVTWKGTQFIAFYNEQQYVVIGKRKLGAKKWHLITTAYRGNATDAHNSISIMADGDGYLHMAWNHHNNPLHYCRSTAPGSLELTKELPMTGLQETRVSYPEFYRMPNGDLLFFYRDGQSGQGNLVINKYDTRRHQWRQLQNNLIGGEDQRSAYWQACVDQQGTIHISWVWRETPDVASNHDMCYARSPDGGITWQKSTGEAYHLPITRANAEYAARIPQGSELINQTSMFADTNGNPCIATYWREAGDSVPQYHIICLAGGQWTIKNLGFRHTAFSLSGAGTRRIPVSRPQIIAWSTPKGLSAALIFRDAERGDRVSAAICTDLSGNQWRVTDLTKEVVGAWEPTYDTELWKEKSILHLFVESVEQVDAEGRADIAPRMVKVLEWKKLK
jgi:hypothetical protein